MPYGCDVEEVGSMEILNTGDKVKYASPDGTTQGQIIDVRGSGSPADGITFTYHVALDGVREVCVIDDPRALTKISE